MAHDKNKKFEEFFIMPQAPKVATAASGKVQLTRPSRVYEMEANSNANALRIKIQEIMKLAALTALTLCVFSIKAQACTNPAGNPGDTIYNDDYAVLQYCDTTNWIAMGSDPSLRPCTTTLNQVGTVSDTDMDDAQDVAVSGNYAYVTGINRDSFAVVDISTPTAPSVTGSIALAANLDQARGVAVSGNYAYVGALAADALTVIDISTPASPTEVGSVSTANLQEAYGVAVSGNYAYVAAAISDALTIVDVSTPSSPSEVGSISNTNLNTATAVDVVGNYAYVTGRTPGRLVIVDITTPASPSQTGFVTVPLGADFGVDVVGNYAYVTSFFNDALSIVDISTPASPSVVGSISNTNLEEAHSVTVSGNYAYVSTGGASDGLVIIDVSNPASPSEVAFVSSTDLGDGGGVYKVGDYIYVASGTADALTIVEETCPANDGGLIGHWKLDETTGTTAFDSTINGNDGTMLGGLDAANDALTGPVGGALDFETADRIDLGNAADLQIGLPVTIAAWINIDNTTSEHAIFDSEVTSGRYSGYSCFTNDSPAILTARFGDDTGSGSADRRDKAGTTSLSANTWYHVACVIRGATDMDLYVNGVDDGGSYIGSGGAISYNGGPSSFVGRTATSGSTTDMTGSIDDVRVYDRALSATEIDALYDMGRDRGLVGHWKLDETAGTTAFDSSPEGNDGTMNGGLSGATDSVTGKIDTALNLDGTADYIDTNYGPVIGASDDFSYAFWFKPDDPNFTVDMVPFGGRNTPSDDPQLYIELDADASACTANYIRARINDDAGGGAQELCSASLPDYNSWNHVAFIYDDDGNISLYVNGALSNSAATGAGIGSTKTFTGDEFAIGARNDSGVYNEFFDGDIDDVRWYNRALSEEDVKSLVERWTPGCSNPLGPEGAAIYNDDFDVMQFCNDDGWQGMGPNGDGGAGCSNPTGAAGDMIYNDDNNVMQFCEGDAWIAIGK